MPNHQIEKRLTRLEQRTKAQESKPQLSVEVVEQSDYWPQNATLVHWGDLIVEVLGSSISWNDI